MARNVVGDMEGDTTGVPNVMIGDMVALPGDIIGNMKIARRYLFSNDDYRVAISSSIMYH